MYAVKPNVYNRMGMGMWQDLCVDGSDQLMQCELRSEQ